MVGWILVLVVGNRSFAADVAQIITCVWNQVLERDNLRSWQRDIEVHFGERSKSSDHSGEERLSKNKPPRRSTKTTQ